MLWLLKWIRSTVAAVFNRDYFSTARSKSFINMREVRGLLDGNIP